MTRRAMLRGEDAFSSVRIARIFEELARPQITQQLPHLAGLKMRGLRGHLGGVIPHGRGDLGQGSSFDTRGEERAGLMAPCAAFRSEDGLAVAAGAGFEAAFLLARGREIAK